MVWFLWHINNYTLFNAKTSLFIYIKYIKFVFAWFSWHINHCRLFNAKYFYTYIGISTIVGYLVLHPVYS